ncbi:MAG: hypothetical protein RR827_04910 [Oscillospiraceae bacterium]
MSDCINRRLYLKQLYFNAGKTMLNEVYNIFEKQLDYSYAQQEYALLLSRLFNDSTITYHDRNSVLFNYLMGRLIGEKLKSTGYIFCIVSPLYDVSVLDGVFFAEENIFIYNDCDYNDFSVCCGYRDNGHLELYDYNFSLANEFFEKSQQV